MRLLTQQEFNHLIPESRKRKVSVLYCHPDYASHVTELMLDFTWKPWKVKNAESGGWEMIDKEEMIRKTEKELKEYFEQDKLYVK